MQQWNLPLAFAATLSSGLGGCKAPPETSTRLVAGEGSFYECPAPAYRCGFAVAAGSDLDHDGRAEWAASAPMGNASTSHDALVVVRAANGEIVAVRQPDAAMRWPQNFGHTLSAGLDVTGDGFPDLAYSLFSAEEYGRAYVASSTDGNLDATLVVDDPDGAQTMPASLALLPGSEGADVLVASQSGYFRWDRFASGVVEAGTQTTSTQANAEVFGAWHDGVYQRVGMVAIAPSEGGSSSSWVGALWQSPDQDHTTAIGTAFVCPDESGLQVPEDCRILGEPGLPNCGQQQIAGDLNGDGLPELVTSGGSEPGADGLVRVYDGTGPLLATIVGTSGTGLGRALTYLVDSDGSPWLVMGQHNMGGDADGIVFAFRGERVLGHLSDKDADRAFTNGTSGPGGAFGHSIATYRETPGSPISLVIGSPYEGDGRVYVVSFEP